MKENPQTSKQLGTTLSPKGKILVTNDKTRARTSQFLSRSPRRVSGANISRNNSRNIENRARTHQNSHR